MALLALSGISVLFIALFSGGTVPGRHELRGRTDADRTSAHRHAGRQRKISSTRTSPPFLVTGVHPVMSSAACWPGGMGGSRARRPRPSRSLACTRTNAAPPPEHRRGPRDLASGPAMSADELMSDEEWVRGLHGSGTDTAYDTGGATPT